MNYTVSTANMFIAEESALCLSINLTSIKSESQSKSKESNKTSVPETSEILWLNSVASDTGESVKERLRKRRVLKQKSDEIYTLQNEMREIESHWSKFTSYCALLLILMRDNIENQTYLAFTPSGFKPTLAIKVSES